MANKQTQPNLQGVQGSYINTNGAPTIPQISWKSPLREIPEIAQGIADFTKQYQSMRFDEYQAKYDTMANNMYHEMADATDPCELQDIKNKYDQMFAKPIDDTVWGKEYMNSTYRRKWEANMQSNYEKVYYGQMHKMSAIQAERKSNEMALAAASTGDVNAIGSYWDSTMVSIGNMQHLTVEQKEALQKNTAKNFVSVMFNKDPVLANSFVQQNSKVLAKYGIDPYDIQDKTANWIRQQEDREYTRNERAKKAQKEALADIGYNALFTLQSGDGTQADYDKFDEALNQIAQQDPKLATTLFKSAYKSTEETKSKKQQAVMNELADKLKSWDNETDETKKEEIGNEIAQYAIENRDTGILNDTNYKWVVKERLGRTEDGIDLFDYAKTHNAQEVEKAILENDINGTKATAMRNIQKEYSGYNAKESYIVEKEGKVPVETIKSWGFPDAQTKTLLDKRQTERTNRGLKSDEYETIANYVRAGRQFPQSLYKKLSNQEKGDLRKLIDDKNNEIRRRNGKAVYADALNGLRTPKNISQLYAEDKITHDAAQYAINAYKDTSLGNVTVAKDDLIKDILENGINNYPDKIAVYEAFESKVSDLYNDTNKANRKKDLEDVLSIYSGLEAPYKTLIENVTKKITEITKNDSLLGGNDILTRISSAKFQEAARTDILKDIKEGKNIKEINDKYNVDYIAKTWFENYKPTTEESETYIDREPSRTAGNEIVELIDPDGEKRKKLVETVDNPTLTGAVKDVAKEVKEEIGNTIDSAKDYYNENYGSKKLTGDGAKDAQNHTMELR